MQFCYHLTLCKGDRKARRFYCVIDIKGRGFFLVQDWRLTKCSHKLEKYHSLFKNTRARCNLPPLSTYMYM